MTTKQQLLSILEKFNGTPESVAAQDAEEATFQAWRNELREVEEVAWVAMKAAEEIGDEQGKAAIVADFNQKRNEIENKYYPKVN